MGGGIAQLAATGASDIFLTGSPSVTHWRAVAHRHVQFAVESIQNVFQGPCDFGTRSSFVLSKSGDLASSTWLQVQLPDLTQYSPYVPQEINASSATIRQAFHTSKYAANVVIAPPSSGTWTFVTALLANAQAAHVLSPTVNAAWATLALGANVAIQLTAPSSPVTTISRYEANVFSTDPANVAHPGLYGNVNGTLTRINVANVAMNTSFYANVYAVYSNATFSQGTTVHWSASNVSTSNSVSVASVTGLPWTAQTQTWTATTVASTATANSSAGSSQTVSNLKWCNNVGSALVTESEFEIGGVRIERHVAAWLDCRQELTETEEKLAGINAMLGNYSSTYDIWDWNNSSSSSMLLFIPLRFFWCRNAVNALPLVAIQFQDVRVSMTFQAAMGLIKSSQPVTTLSPTPAMVSCQPWVDYVMLEQSERVRFSSQPLEMLVELTQYNGSEPILGKDSSAFGGMSVNRKVNLAFTQPTKELVFCYQANGNYTVNPYTGNNWFDYDIPGSPNTDPWDTCQLFFNGHARFSSRPSQYFRQVVPYQYHTRVPTKKVYVWSAALNPEDATQPSGSVNASRLDSIQLALQLNQNILSGQVLVFAVSWNCLRIEGGLAGLVFASG